MLIMQLVQEDIANLVALKWRGAEPVKKMFLPAKYLVLILKPATANSVVSSFPTVTDASPMSQTFV